MYSGCVLTQEILKQNLHYNPDTGLFTWVFSNRARKTGQAAGTVTVYGYIQISLMGKLYKAQRLAWLYMTGEWPNLTVDHKNRQQQDNRWGNLRLATPSQQSANRSKSKPKSGCKGVTYRSRYIHPWSAYIGVNRKQICIGRFDTKEEAAKAYQQAAQRIFGEYHCNEISLTSPDNPT